MNYFINAITSKYATFSGRASRTEYWSFILIYLILQLLISFLPLGLIVNYVLFGLYVALFIPSLAIAVRRLHDIDKSGWMVLLGFIPVVGAVVLIVLFCLPGTPQKNRFGKAPLPIQEATSIM